MKKSRKVGASDATRKSATKKGKKFSGSAISTSSPLGMLALHLREQWKKFGRDGLVFLAEDENRPSGSAASSMHLIHRSMFSYSLD